MTEQNANKSILVTGASGYVGSRLVEHLNELGHAKVFTIAGRRDFASKLDAILSKNSIDCIVHAGFEVDFNPRTEKTGEPENIRNTRLIAEAVSKHRIPHIVFLSAAAVLGVSRSDIARNENSIGTADPEFSAFMETGYVSDKLGCEKVLQGVPSSSTVTTFYMTTVYGKKMTCETYRSLMGVKGPSPLMVVPPGGTSFLALDDFLSAMDLVIEKKIGGSFVLSSGNITYEVLYDSVAKVLGVRYRKVKFLIRPSMRKPLLKAVSAMKKKVLTTAVIESTFGYKYYSPKKLATTLGWQPRISLEQALWKMLMHEVIKELK